MKNYKLHTSEGVKDYLGKELLVKEEIEKRIKDLFICHGYELVKTPTFEYIDVFSNGHVLQQPTLYSLINRQGEVLALRNDMTSSIARIVATHDANAIFPKKYCYIANTFRYPRAYQGKSHEFTQAGIEIIGVDNVKSDVECITLAFKSLKKIGLDKFTIHIGSTEFIEGLFNEFNLSNNQREILFSIIESKDFVSLKNKMVEYKIDNKYVDLVLMIMSNAGKLNFLDSVIARLEGFDSIKYLERLSIVYHELMKLGLQNKVVFDFSVYSSAKYYTGLTFQVFAEGIGRAVVSGGRCDSLLSNFGASRPMIGFGLHVDSILEYVMNHDLISISHIKYLSHCDSEGHSFALEKNTEFREQGIIVSESVFYSLNEAIEYAKINKYNRVLNYTNDKLEIIELGGE